MKSKEQIEDLKKDWLDDPCWDIEDTEGFEEHRTELQLFRLKMENKNRRIYQKQLVFLSNKMGTQSQRLIEYLCSLETDINRLKNEVNQLKGE